MAVLSVMASACGNSTDTSRIAYTVCSGEEDELDCDVYVTHPDGSGTRNLTDRRGLDVSPAWSPNGKRIAFLSGTFGSIDIWMTREDSQLDRLTDSGDWEGELLWSPDSKYIASYTCRDFCDCIYPDPSCMIEVIRVDNRERRALTGGYPLAWSADSQSIFYSYICCASVSGGVRNIGPVTTRDIYAVDVETGSSRQLISASGDVVNPVFSPDGSQVAYVFQCCGDVIHSSELHLMNSDGSNRRPVVSDMRVGEAAWSPSGGLLAFLGDSAIYTVRPDGTDLTALPLTFEGVPSPKDWEDWVDYELADLSWSNDGRTLLFSYHGDIWAIGADGTGLVNLTDHVEQDASGPVWSPQ